MITELGKVLFYRLMAIAKQKLSYLSKLFVTLQHFLFINIDITGLQYKVTNIFSNSGRVRRMSQCMA